MLLNHKCPICKKIYEREGKTTPIKEEGYYISNNNKNIVLTQSIFGAKVFKTLKSIKQFVKKLRENYSIAHSDIMEFIETGNR